MFTCPHCAGEVVFLDEALDQQTKRVRDSFPCPQCSAELTKQRMEKRYESKFDEAASDTIKGPKRKPVVICYMVAGRRYEKAPSAEDLTALQRAENLGLSSGIPTIHIPPMHMTHERARMDYSGITHVHHFFLPRAAYAMGALWGKASAHGDARIHQMLLFFVEQAVWGMSVLARYAPC